MFDFFKDITFANKELFWLLPVIPLTIAWYIWKNKTYHAELNVSSFENFQGLKPTVKQYFRHSLIVLRIFFSYAADHRPREATIALKLERR